ncbi:MAG: ATP-binding protein [Planctomycetes bacterium]|nr:ATP-binding protein [Nannocystis sp.]MBA3546305.1 ATP-binding protein [Nannocystis sp.]MBA3845088.1 ATP-binding protein [Planctomycetota bacterium]
MSTIASIIAGTAPGPRRILVYGTAGIGKSTFAIQAPRSIAIQTEDGLGAIDCHRFPLAASFAEVMNAITALYREQHDYGTVVIDSLDWLERLIWAEVCRLRQVATIEDIPYGKGYTFALPLWQNVLDGLAALRAERGMTIILIAHTKVERFEDPETDSYDRYAPRLHKTASAVITEWCDEVLFAAYRVHTRTSDEGFNRTRTHAIGSGERVLRTTERPSHLAKNRLNLPDELPLAWSSFAAHLPPTDPIPAAPTTR